MENNEKRKQLIALRNGEMVAENANEYWSDDDNRKSGEMFENGYGVSDIALTLKRTEVSVMCSLQNRGLFAKQCRPRTPKAGKTKRCMCPGCDCNSCPNQGKDCMKQS